MRRRNAARERPTSACSCRSDTSTPWHAWALRLHSYFVSLLILAYSYRQDSDTNMTTPTAQTVRRWVMTGSVAAITATGAWYGAGLKAQQEFKQVHRYLCCPQHMSFHVLMSSNRRRRFCKKLARPTGSNSSRSLVEICCERRRHSKENLTNYLRENPRPRTSHDPEMYLVYIDESLPTEALRHRKK